MDILVVAIVLSVIAYRVYFRIKHKSANTPYRSGTPEYVAYKKLHSMHFLGIILSLALLSMLSLLIKLFYTSNVISYILLALKAVSSVLIFYLFWYLLFKDTIKNK